MRNKDAQVTYIKNNIEKTIVINAFTNLLFLKEVCFVERDYLEEKIYKLNKDVQFVHFKNFLFKDIIKIECASDAICIFEDCMFSKQELGSSILYLDGGIFEFIDSFFYNVKDIDANTFSPVDVNIIYTKKGNQVDNKVSGVIGNGNYFTSLTIVEDENNINEFMVHSKEVILKKNFQTDVFKIKGENVMIGGDDCLTRVTNNAEFSYPPVIDASKRLELKNCSIENNSFLKNRMLIEAPYIEINNITISSKYSSIKINDNEFTRKEYDKFVVNDIDILRANLMNCLIGRKEQLEKLIDLEVEKILDGVKFPRKQEIEDLEIRIIKKKEELKCLQCELQEMKIYLRGDFIKKENAIKKSLSKKSPKYFEK